MGSKACQITSLTIVYPTVYSGADHRKHQSSVSPAFVRGIHRWPVNSPYKGPVSRKMFPFDDVIMRTVFVHRLAIIGCYCSGETNPAKTKKLTGFRPLDISLKVMVHDDVIRWKYFPRYWPLMQSFGVLFGLCLNKRSSKQSWGWWFETPSRSSWRHCNVIWFMWRYCHSQAQHGGCWFPGAYLASAYLQQPWWHSAGCGC